MNGFCRDVAIVSRASDSELSRAVVEEGVSWDGRVDDGGTVKAGVDDDALVVWLSVDTGVGTSGCPFAAILASLWACISSGVYFTSGILTPV